MLLSILVGNGAQLSAMVGVTLGMSIVLFVTMHADIWLCPDQYSRCWDSCLHQIVVPSRP